MLHLRASRRDYEGCSLLTYTSETADVSEGNMATIFAAKNNPSEYPADVSKLTKLKEMFLRNVRRYTIQTQMLTSVFKYLLESSNTEYLLNNVKIMSLHNIIYMSRDGPVGVTTCCELDDR
jgi:hypothetical protein